MASFSDIYNAAQQQLGHFEKYIKGLPDMEALTKSPIEAVFVDMTLFEDIARVLGKLREFTNVPAQGGGMSFFNNNRNTTTRPDVNLSQVTALEERYAAALELYGQKAKVPNMERIIESIMHHLQLYTAEPAQAPLSRPSAGI